MIVVLSILFVFATLAALLAVAKWRLMRRFRRARTRIPLERCLLALRTMLRQLRPGALFAAAPNGRDGFLQLILTDREGNWREVEFGLPDADWSRARFDHAVAVLGELEPDCEVEHTPGNPDVPRFLRVWIHGGEASVLERATALVRAAAEVLGFPEEQTYNLVFRGQDHPDYMRELADLVEQDPSIPRLLRKLGPLFRKQADEAERAMNAAG